MRSILSTITTNLVKTTPIPWLRRHHVGAGLMGEQGTESIHAH